MPLLPPEMIRLIASFCDIDARVALVGVQRLQHIPDLRFPKAKRSHYDSVLVLYLPQPIPNGWYVRSYWGAHNAGTFSFCRPAPPASLQQWIQSEDGTWRRKGYIYN